jgi:hypothetical protein
MTNTQFCSAALVASVSICGCSHTKQHQETTAAVLSTDGGHATIALPDSPKAIAGDYAPVELRSTPQDLSTSVGSGPISILLSKGISSGDDVFKHVDIVRWPSLEPAVAKDPEVITREGGGLTEILELATTEGNDWYAIRLSNLPAGLAIRPEGALTIPQGQLVRFRMAPGPVLRRLTFCSDDAGVTVVTIEFSEPVLLGRGATAWTVMQKDATCGVPGGKEVGNAEAQTPMYWIECAKLDLKTAFKIVQNADVLGASGVTLKGLRGEEKVELDIHPDDLVQKDGAASNCALYTPK